MLTLVAKMKASRTTRAPSHQQRGTMKAAQMALQLLMRTTPKMLRAPGEQCRDHRTVCYQCGELSKLMRDAHALTCAVDTSRR